MLTQQHKKIIAISVFALAGIVLAWNFWPHRKAVDERNVRNTVITCQKCGASLTLTPDQLKEWVADSNRVAYGTSENPKQPAFKCEKCKAFTMIEKRN